MEQKNVSVITFIVVGLAVGFFIGRYSATAGVLPEAVQSSEFRELQQQIAEARKLLPSAPQDMRSVSGTVTKIEGSVVTLTVDASNPFENLPKVRKATIVDATKITRVVPKDVSVFEAELKAYESARAGRAENAPLIHPPLPFLDAPATLADIATGMSVTVSASENIRNSAAFNAETVQIDFRPAPIPELQ